jgi:hypothetical protein
MSCFEWGCRNIIVEIQRKSAKESRKEEKIVEKGVGGVEVSLAKFWSLM